MKNLLRISALALFILKNIAGFAQSPFTSTEVPIGAKETVIASAVTANNHLYVLIAQKPKDGSGTYNAKGKITLMHLDESRKVVVKKPVKLPLIGKNQVEIKALYEVGTQLVVIGTSEDYKKMIITSCYFTIDENTMMASKATTIIENKFQWYFGSDSRNQFTFSQHQPGTTLGVRLAYGEPVSAGENRTITEWSAIYFVINAKGEYREALKYKYENEKTDKHNEGFTMAPDNCMYILYTEIPHTEYDFELHDYTEESIERLKKGECRTSLFCYSVDDDSKKDFLLHFADPLLGCDEVLLHYDEQGVYISGFATNSFSNYVRILNEDTAGLKLMRSVFTVKIDKTLDRLNVNDIALFDQQLYDELTKVDELSTKDREIGNEENLSIIGCSRNAAGEFVLVCAAYVQWNWPPYDEIKNNKQYDFTKDDEGKIIGVSGPSPTTRFEFQSIVTLTLEAATKKLSGTKKEITYEVSTGSFGRGVDFSEWFLFKSQKSEFYTVYLNGKSGNGSQLRSFHSEKGDRSFVSYPAQMSFVPGCGNMIHSSVLVINGTKEFIVVDLKE